ncbi:DUF2569 domain-containing protein [Escherichia sp. E10V10]|uniref:DUF2569 domain-containing protein n=1 Tax=unclassified Escherichia TaxID=2608889 RepID=UPI00102910AA|nr:MULTISPECIES: DUF2569 domain-containing protein [unclassified Escherichia]RZN53879.1 DUF2569 domain-containing protein [Escherichia sp. E10V10]TGB71293.1 hypothetical protein CRI67_24010 [Escherichia sp. E4702]
MWAKEGEDLRTTCKNCGVAVLPPDDYCKSCADKKLMGIGGWLYLPAISLVLVIISSIYSFIQTWGLVQGNQEEPLRTLLYLEVVGFAMVFLLVSYTTFLFFKKKRQLPHYYIALLLSLFVFNVADIWGAVQFLHATIEPLDAWGVLKNIIHMAIWIPYFRVSKRVKLTFVN